MEATLRATIDNGTLPQRYRSSIGQFIRAPGGRQIRLQNIDNTMTPAGTIYWRLRGIRPPTMYNYDQGLINDKWVRSSHALVAEQGPYVLAVQPYMGGVAQIVEATATA